MAATPSGRVAPSGTRGKDLAFEAGRPRWGAGWCERHRRQDQQTTRRRCGPRRSPGSSGAFTDGFIAGAPASHLSSRRANARANGHPLFAPRRSSTRPVARHSVRRANPQRNGTKGVCHVNLIDELTQFERVGAVAAVSEAFLVPVREGMLVALPLPVLGFHADDGPEYVNHLGRRDAQQAARAGLHPLAGATRQRQRPGRGQGRWRGAPVAQPPPHPAALRAAGRCRLPGRAVAVPELPSPQACSPPRGATPGARYGAATGAGTWRRPARRSSRRTAPSASASPA